MPPANEESRSRIGTVIAEKYRIIGVLGRGGMGTVYEAVHTGIGKHVALKFLEGHFDGGARTRARFLREAQTASLVESPHVVHIFDSGLSEDGVPYMVLELLRGKDLRALLRTEGRLPVEQAVGIAEQALRALVQTHAAGIVHRDLKPENIFLCEIEGSDPLVKLLDFGISKVTHSQPGLDTLTHEDTVLGTTFYMSPEQAQGQAVDARSDIYGLGTILYEMLTGRTPYVGNVQHAVLVDICTHDAPDVRLLAPQVPAELARIIARALDRKREQRFETAQSFLAAITSFALNYGPRTQLTSATRVSTPALVAPTHEATEARPNGKSTRSGKVIALTLVVTLLLAGLSIALVNKRLKNDRERERAALWGRATVTTSTVAPTQTPAGSSSPIITTAPPAASSAPQASTHTNANPTPRPPSTTRSGRSPNQRAPAASAELRLRTTMP